MYDSKEKRQAYAREHYQKNKELYKFRALVRKKKAQAALHEMNRKLKEGPCSDCGGRFHHCQMDWDHLNDKVMGVAKMINQGFSEKKVLDEIAKCELVCANCHRLRTWNRAEVVE